MVPGWFAGGSWAAPRWLVGRSWVLLLVRCWFCWLSGGTWLASWCWSWVVRSWLMSMLVLGLSPLVGWLVFPFCFVCQAIPTSLGLCSLCQYDSLLVRGWFAFRLLLLRGWLALDPRWLVGGSWLARGLLLVLGWFRLVAWLVHRVCCVFLARFCFASHSA